MQKVARFMRALPSSMISSRTMASACSASMESFGKRYFGAPARRSLDAYTASASLSRTPWLLCSATPEPPRLARHSAALSDGAMADLNEFGTSAGGAPGGGGGAETEPGPILHGRNDADDPAFRDNSIPVL